MANIMAKVVIKTALNRFLAAIFTASFASMPLFAKWFAKSTTKMAFLPTMPKSKMTPTMTNRLNGLPLIKSPITTPQKASGMASIMRNGSKKLS